MEEDEEPEAEIDRLLRELGLDLPDADDGDERSGFTPLLDDFDGWE